MRVVLIGQAAFAEKTLEVLQTRGENVVHVFAPPDVPGGRPDPLKLKAQQLGLPLSQPASFKGEAALEQFKALDADLGVMAFVTIIVPERILFAPRLKTICFHPSLLPRHRGASAINWTLIHGDEESGISWFWPDRGIDTGPILLQRRVKIGPDETTGSLYFNTLFPLGIETLSEAMDLIEAGAPPRLEQDETFASYEPICRDEHARIDFVRSAREIYNLIRGCDPQPGAWATLDGRQVRFFDAALEPPPRRYATPAGTIIGIDQQAMRIALSDGVLLIRRLRVDANPKKIPPIEASIGGFLVAGGRFA